VRPSADALVEAVLVLSTLGAPERRRFKRRRPEAVTEAEPEPVPTSRATIVRSAPFASAEEAADWLAGLRSGSAGERGGESALGSEVDAAVAVLNRALRAHRAAAADPYVAELAASRALVVRVGYGSGEEVADGRYVEAYELPRGGTRRARRSMEAPEERFAMLLSGRVEALPAEELVLRARADLNAGRPREAALQARVAIEALLAALDDGTEGGAAPAAAIASVTSHRDAVAAAANAALRGEVPGDSTAALEEAVAAMEQALKRHRLGG
jgi:hypothetical protein